MDWIPDAARGLAAWRERPIAGTQIPDNHTEWISRDVIPRGPSQQRRIPVSPGTFAARLQIKPDTRNTMLNGRGALHATAMGILI